MKPLNQLSDEELTRLAHRAAALPDAPPHRVHKAIALWDASHPVSVAAAVRRIAAVLSFDSWAGGAAAAGVRSVPSDSRHLLFNAQGRDIDLRIVPLKNGFALSGQILGPDDAGQVALSAETDDGSGPVPLRVAELDALGEFHMDGVARGVYRLTLHVGGEAIELPRIEVGERGE
jgi:hypothetical protein